MAIVFTEKDTVIFVGGRGTKAGFIFGGGGGVTADQWASDPTLATYMGANGEELVVGAFPITSGGGGNCRYNSVGAFTAIEIGMIALCNFVPGFAYDGLDGRYEVVARDDDWIEIALGWIADESNGIAIGGAFGDAQSAFDATDATTYNVEIFTNKDEALTATLDLDSGGSESNGTYKRLKGFSTSVEDTGKVTYTDNGATHGIATLADNLVVENIIISGFTGSHGFRIYGNEHIRIINCEGISCTHGFVVGSGYDVLLMDCIAHNNSERGFWALYSAGAAFTKLIDCLSYSNTRYGFQLGGAEGTSARGCIAYDNGNGGTKYSGFLLDANRNGSSVENCVSYNNGKHGFELSWNVSHVINCIALSNGATNASYYGFFSVAAAGAWGVPIVDYCDSYNNGSGGDKNYSLVLPERNSLEVDPQFVDAAGGDFTPRNPNVLRGGKSDINGNLMPMGAIFAPQHFSQGSRAFNPGRLSIIRN